jgi:hypothetical protein
MKTAKELAAEIMALKINKEASILIAIAEGVGLGWKKHKDSLEPDPQQSAGRD